MVLEPHQSQPSRSLLNRTSHFHWERGDSKTQDVIGLSLGLQGAKPRELNVFDSYRGAKGRNMFLGETSDYTQVQRRCQI